MTTTTQEQHRAHLEELRNLSAQLKNVVIDVTRPNRQAIYDRKAAVDYAIGILEDHRPPGRHLQVIVNDQGASTDATT